MAAREPMGTGGWSHELALFCPAFRFDSTFNTGYQAQLNIKPRSLLIFAVDWIFDCGCDIGRLFDLTIGIIVIDGFVIRFFW
jgi:hypothetical protein